MRLCGIHVNCRQIDDLLAYSNECKILVTANSEAFVRAQTEPGLKKVMDENYVSIDGQIPLWLFNIKYPNVLIKKISGSDLIYVLAEWACQHKKKLFLLGGKQESNRHSVAKLKELYPELNIDGFSPKHEPYPFSKESEIQIWKKISEFRPDIIFVGFGMGKQEFWEDAHKQQCTDLGVKLMVGSGGTFEFVSGMIKRAPILIQKSGLEGIWRLINEFKWFRVKRLLLSFKIFYYFFKIK